MRFNLHLTIEKTIYGDVLPFSYQYELASYIYRTMAKGDEQYAGWLHANGFKPDSGKPFRLFCFSNLLVDRTRTTPDNRLRLLSDTAQLQIAFLPEQSTETFVKGLFAEQIFTIGDRQSKVQFAVRSVEMLPDPLLNGELVGETLSPLSLSKRAENGYPDYYSPAEPKAIEAIRDNLLEKYEAFYRRPFAGDTTFEWEVLNEPHSKLITIKSGTPKQSKVKGYLCKFRLKADDALLKIALNGGIGEKGSMGFGMAGRIDRITEFSEFTK